MKLRIPTLDPVVRDREFKSYTIEEKSKIVKAWLFNTSGGHREIDSGILGLDRYKTRGYQSMGVLHYLGLKKEYKGLFEGVELTDAIKALEDDVQDFSHVIALLTHNEKEIHSKTQEQLVEIGRNNSRFFDRNLRQRLEEMTITDIVRTKGSARREQALLRAILLEDRQEIDCALCEKMLPTQLIVAAHIKPRSHCSLIERTDINVAMPICKIGCDDLFEKGFVVVGASGLAQIQDSMTTSKDLASFLQQYENKRCKYFNPHTEKYFEYRNRL